MRISPTRKNCHLSDWKNPWQPFKELRTVVRKSGKRGVGIYSPGHDATKGDPFILELSFNIGFPCSVLSPTRHRQ